MPNNNEIKKANDTSDAVMTALQGVQKYMDDNKSRKKSEYLQMNSAEKFKTLVRCDSWKLKDEAIPLIMGIPPDYMHSIDNFNWSTYHSIFKVAVKCANISLEVLNPSESEKKWEVDADNFYVGQ